MARRQLQRHDLHPLLPADGNLTSRAALPRDEVGSEVQADCAQRRPHNRQPGGKPFSDLSSSRSASGQFPLALRRRASFEGGGAGRTLCGDGRARPVRASVENGGIVMTREYVIHAAALGVAFDIAVKRLAEISGEDARQNIESVRDEAITLFKNAEVPPEHDLDQALIVAPAIELLEGLFGASLERLSIDE